MLINQRINGGVPSWPRTQRPGFGVTGGYCLLQWLGSCGVTGGNGSSLRLPTAHEEYLPAPRAQGRWQQVAHHRYRKATETCDLWCLGDGVTFLLKRMNWITVHTHIYIYWFSAPIFADMFILGVKADFNIIIYIFFLGGSVPCHLERNTFCHLLSYKLITLRIGVYLKSDLSE